MIWLTLLFTLGYAGQAALLIALGTDATPLLKAFAIGNGIVCSMLLWGWCMVLGVQGERRAARRRLVPVAVLLLAPAFFLPTAANWYQEARIAMRTADTDLADVTDEPLYSARGNVIGVRIGFTLIPPQTGYYSVEPVLRAPLEVESAIDQTLRARGAVSDLLDLRTVRRTIDPEPRAINVRRQADDALERTGGGLYLEEGVAYGFTFDFLPAYLIDPRDPLPVRNATGFVSYCLSLPETEAQSSTSALLSSLDRPLRWRLAITQTTFGWGQGADPLNATNEAYSPAMFYRGILAEGAPACASGR